MSSSRKRSHPDDHSPLPVPRVLASREMFFSIPLRTVAVHNQPLEAFAGPLLGPHVLANSRVTDTDTILNGLQRASLTAVLAVLNDYFPGEETTRVFTESVGDIAGTNDTALAAFADKIDMGLIAFLAKRGAPDATVSSSSTPAPDAPPVLESATATSSTTAVPPKRARVSKKSGLSSRSQKIRKACISRDDEQCRLCKVGMGQSAHILPFSLQQGRRAVDFWAFVAMFKGAAATDQLKAAALDPDATDSDNIMNVLFLCYTCHALLDKNMVSLIPQILESPDSVFPYDPRSVDHYDAVVEFPAGLQRAVIQVLQDDGEGRRLRPGHVLTLRTADPTTLPLPHPLLLQLHAICSRMVVMRAAAGYPVLADDDDSDGDTVFDALETDEGVGEDLAQPKECFTEFGGKDVSRDPELVIRELDQRKYEQGQLLVKLRARGGRRLWRLKCV